MSERTEQALIISHREGARRALHYGTMNENQHSSVSTEILTREKDINALTPEAVHV